MNTLKPFKKFCITLGEIPSSYLESMSYYETLIWLCNYLSKTIEPSIIETQEAVKELQEFVSQYFDNLDVQEEINNKLDEMAEDGTLEEIITSYLNVKGVLGYNTILDMKNATNLIDGSIAKTLGKNNYLDGEGAFYKIREILNTDVVDEVNIIALNNSNTLIAELIPYTNIKDLIEELETKIDNNSRNSKWVAPMFCDNEYRQSINYVTSLLTECKNAGFKEAQMLIHIQSDGNIIEDINKFASYNEIANSLNIPITSVKYHGTYNEYYENAVLNTISYFPQAKTIFIFNEQLSNILEYGLTLPTTIKETFTNIEKVGFTITYPNLYQTTLTESEWTSLSNVYDIMGLNIYPSCATFENAKLTTYDKVLNAFNNPSYNLNWIKEIWITESGVLPYWQFLENPANYNLELLTDTTKSFEPQRIFFRSLADCDLAKQVIKICPWFLESGMTLTDNYVLFRDILKNIITNR